MTQDYLPGFEPPALPDDQRRRLDDLAAFPDVSTEALQRHAAVLGAAGERLVDSLLLRRGEDPKETGPALAYDRALLRDRALVLIQVKTCCLPREDGCYHFLLKRGFRASGGVRGYAPHDFHIAALVCLDENVVLFTTDPGPSFRIDARHVAELRARPFASYDRCLDELGLARAAVAPVLLPAVA